MMARRSFLRTSILTSALLSVPPAMATPAPAVSPTLTALITEYLQRTAALDALPEGDPAWDRVSDLRMRAVDRLLDYRPCNLVEVVAKVEALKPFISEDVDLVSLDVVLDDIRALAGEVAP